MNKKHIHNFIEKAYREEKFTNKEIINLLKLDNEKSQELFEAADFIRKKYVGDDVHLRGLIEFSNICERNCRYCGLRRDNKKLSRYRLTPEEIFNYAEKCEKLGYRTVVLQSGEDSFYTAEIISDIVREIKQRTNLAVALCIGERKREEYEQIFDAGTDRYLLKFETSDPELYYKLHPDLKYENRRKKVLELKEIGYQIGSGIIVGLPGQTIESIANDIKWFDELELDMIAIGPYIHHPDTPLENIKLNDLSLVLKIVAITRIITKDTLIPATTAISTIDVFNGRQRILKAGGNVIMPNVTPVYLRKKYEIYPKNKKLYIEPEKLKEEIEKMIVSMGRKVAKKRGDSYKRYPLHKKLVLQE